MIIPDLFKFLSTGFKRHPANSILLLINGEIAIIQCHLYYVKNSHLQDWNGIMWFPRMQQLICWDTWYYMPHVFFRYGNSYAQFPFSLCEGHPAGKKTLFWHINITVSDYLQNGVRPINPPRIILPQTHKCCIP